MPIHHLSVTKDVLFAHGPYETMSVYVKIVWGHKLVEPQISCSGFDKKEKCSVPGSRSMVRTKEREPGTGQDK